MMGYKNGMRHTSPDDLRSPGDAYLTEGWVIAHWLRQTLFRAPPNLLIWDPAACGVNGWSIGLALGLALGRKVILSDIRPMGRGVAVGKYPAPRPKHKGPVLHATNPPFSELDEWIDTWRSDAQPGDALLLVTDAGALTTDRPRAYGMSERIQPCKRFAFGLTEEDAARARELLKEGKPAPKPSEAEHKTGPTGVGMPGTGKAHCISLWTCPASPWSGTREVCEEVVPFDLRVGLDLMRWCYETEATMPDLRPKIEAEPMEGA